MKAYGYTKDYDENEHGYSEVSEVAISVTPEQLREMSSFLLKAAKDMESMGDEYDHIYLQDTSSKWNESWFDIVVAKSE